MVSIVPISLTDPPSWKGVTKQVLINISGHNESDI